jgi:hypothetical protein
MLKSLCAAIVGLAAAGMVASVATGPTHASGSPNVSVTFTKNVAPILYKNCTTCHRPGEAAPMSLLTYKDARPWAKAIRQQVVDGVMPPWHADPRYGAFQNDRRLTPQEVETITSWVSQGAAEGDPTDLPPPPAYEDGWNIGKPDLVISMQEDYAVPADGVVDYQHFEVPTNLTEDQWIQAAEIRPGNRSLVHHVIVYVREPGGQTVTPSGILLNPSPAAAAAALNPTPAASAASPASTTAAATPTTATSPAPAGNPGNSRTRGVFLVGTAPGARPVVFEPGTAKSMKAGSVITFQVHYTPNGVPGKDRTSVGLVFAKQPPVRRTRTVGVWNTRFVIPAGDGNHKVESEALFTEDAQVFSFFPHMHLRGKSFEYRVQYPDGRSEILLSVPKYDFNWQGDYILREPLRVPKGARLLCTAYFDNSTKNRANPDPAQVVRWGDQTWEEMMIGWMTYATTPQESR